MLSNDQEELNGLIEIRDEWKKKRRRFQLAEAKESDTSKLHTIEENINNANRKIDEFDEQINNLRGGVSIMLKIK